MDSKRFLQGQGSRRAGRWPAALAFFLLMGGCTLAPSYDRPDSPVGEGFPDYPEYQGVGTESRPARAAEGAVPPAPGAELAAWEDFYADPNLQKFIAQALQHNRDLRLAALSMERARALYQIQRSELLPSIGAAGSAANQKGPTFQPPPLPDAAISRRYSLNVGVTSYELDLFGRVRSLKDAALENYLASSYAGQSLRLSLVGELASSYL
ncbi:MAG: TolC family protein, partial [Deltaproteobacteria bacterium]|nr:TolC family protein [Deltaproteobacteria bacterium]